MNNKRETKEQDDAEIAFLIQRERERVRSIKRRYTEDDLVFAWGCGYEARKREEVETGGLWT